MGVLNTLGSGLNVLFTPVLYGVVASLALQLSTWDKGDRTQDKLRDKDSSVVPKDAFDFIIIGGGTSGSIVANRLSEFYSVLLLESGGEPNPLVYVPGLASNLINRPEVDWMFKTVAQKKACGLSQFKRASWSGGKGLGGSGNLDWMIHHRGSPRDFNNWAKLVKDKEWNYQNMMRHFRRHENFVGNTTDGDAHAEGGEITVQLPDYRPLAAQFVWAGKELGYKNVDMNGHFTEAFDEIFYPTKRGEKQTSYKTFLEPVKRRENLTIRRYATVTKILLRKEDNSAYGVEYERHGQKVTVTASNEVILSAGSVGSPKILLSSGIGPRKHLEDVGVKPLVNLPVGRNLQDHLGVFLGPFFMKDPLSFNFDRDVTAKGFFEYGTYGTGPLTSTGYQALGLISSKFAKLRGEGEWPDLELILRGVSVHGGYASDMSHAFGLQENVLKRYYNHAVGKHSFHVVVGLGRPYARGEVRLASKGFSAPLIIDPRYLDDPWDFDMKTMVEGVKKAVNLVEGTKRFQSLEAQFTTEVLPGCEKVEFRSDGYWECFVKQMSVSLQNPVGTCSMGPRSSPHAVVDSQLRVIGVRGLRIIDASVMPSIVIAGTQAATMAIAEKGAESILKKWKNRESDPSEQSFAERPKSSASVNIVTTTTPVPPTMAPSPPTSTKLSVFQNGQFHNFEFNMDTGGVTPSGSKENYWQNTLDSLAQFSKSIQHSVKVPKVTTTTSTKAPPQKLVEYNYTEEVIRAPQILKTVTVAPSKVTVTTSEGHPPAFAPMPTQQNVPAKAASPTLKASPSPTPTTPIPRPTTFRPVDDFRFELQASRFNKTINNPQFSLNVPIVPMATPTPSPRPFHSVKIYTAAPATAGGGGSRPPSAMHFIKHLFQKERPRRPPTPFDVQNPLFILPQSSTPQFTATPTPLPEILHVTTMRPHGHHGSGGRNRASPGYRPRPMIEVVSSDDGLPSGYENLLELPISGIEYLRGPNPQQSHPPPPPSPPIPTKITTYTMPSTTSMVTSSSYPSMSTVTTSTFEGPPPPIKIIPAVSVPIPARYQTQNSNPLETTTTRVTSEASTFHRELTQHPNQIRTYPQDIFLRELEPFKLVEMSTVTEIPMNLNPTTPEVTTSLTMHSEMVSQPSEIRQKSKPSNILTSSESPIYYVVRKKNQDAPSPSRPPRKFHRAPNSISHGSPVPFLRKKPPPSRRHRPRQRSRRPSRPHGHSHGNGPMIMASQTQTHFPVFSLPPNNYEPGSYRQGQRSRSRSHSRPSHTFMEILEEPMGLTSSGSSSEQVFTSMSGPGFMSGGGDNDGVITAAISSPLYQQNVLNQLIPIEK